MQSIPIKNVGNEQGLIDQFQRRYTYLRLSITDVCNFRCNYCLPHGYCRPESKQTFLTLDEIRRLATVFADLGTEKIRITGANQPYAKIF